MKRMMNDTYDKHYDKQRKAQVIILIALIITMLGVTSISALRIYMLNGYDKQWDFSLSSKCDRCGANYKYSVDDKEYVCYQFATADGADETFKLQVYYNIEYPMFSYVYPFQKEKITDIKLYTMSAILVLLVFIMGVLLSELGFSRVDLRDKHENRIARELERVRTN
jgi:hypothetical protein